MNIIYAYDRPERGEPVLLYLNLLIYMCNKNYYVLFYPNQLRSFGVQVGKRPSLYFINESNVQCIIADNIKLPLQAKGLIAIFPIQCPIKKKMASFDIQHVTPTSPYGWELYGIDSLQPSQNKL